MKIELWIAKTDPPEGVATWEHGPDDSDEAAPLTFVGWLGLLGALSRLVDAAGDKRRPD